MSKNQENQTEAFSQKDKIFWEDILSSEAARLLGRVDLNIVAKNLISLQRGLTGTRDLVGGQYMSEKRSLAAYLLFYWQVTAAQMTGILNMAFPGDTCPTTPFAETNELRILDIGSGPAPASLAAALWFQQRQRSAYKDTKPTIHIQALDQSELALQSAQRLAQAAGISLTGTAPWDATKDPPSTSSQDIIIISHLLNELWALSADRLQRRKDFLVSHLEQLKSGGYFILLEPALLATSRDTLAIRDSLITEGYQILAPCYFTGPCPALALEGQTCHSDFTWKVPPVVRDLAERTGLGKDLVKTAAFVFRKPQATQRSMHVAEDSSNLYRVVSEPMLNKAGRIRLLLCGKDGRFPLSAKPGELFPAEKDFLRLRRSDSLRLQGAVPRETGFGLGPDTTITLE